jgi:GAF domain-containing protein/anti-sigma regulatory factor (Ser/Thr protein kinase)
VQRKGNEQTLRDQAPIAEEEGDELLGGEPVTLRLPPDLRSVSQGRAKLAEIATAWGCPVHLLDDARVVLSEIMSNGVLHARTEMRVVISRRGKGLRLEVHDDSPAPLLPPPALVEGTISLLDEPLQLELMGPLFPPAATGRGLAIVSALASAWGWYPEAGGGKIVWAELGTVETDERGVGRGSSERQAHVMRPVRVVAAPLRLLRESEDHFDDLFRELQMASLGGQGDNARPGARQVVARLAPLAEHVKGRLAPMREPVRRAIWEAVRRGDRLIDLNLLADAGMPSVFEMFAELLTESAIGARRGFLLTEPPSREVVAWRQWLRNEMESQIAGRLPRACPFPVSSVGAVETGASWERLDAARKDAVSQLRSLLGGKLSHRLGDGTLPVRPGFAEDELMVHALGRILAFLGARRAALCLLADDNVTVNFGASLGFRNEVADYWEAVSVSADLPSSEVIRTGRPALFRTFAELDERYPIFLSTPSESDPALACVPLVAGVGPAVGCLVLGFPKARDFSRREVTFLMQLAGEVASYLTTWGRQDAAERSAVRHRALEDARRAIDVAENTDELVTLLVEATASLVSEGASVHLLGNGGLRYLTTYHRDPMWVAEAAELLRKRLGNSTDMVVECARTGQPAVLQFFPEEVIVASAADDDEAARFRRLAIGSAGVFPIRDNGRLLGVLSFSNGVGRFISDEDLAFVERLADQAGGTLARLGF